MLKKNCTILGIFSIVLFSLVSCIIAAGSYPYVEEYDFKVKEADLITAIKTFKQNNPDYCVPEEFKLVDGRSNDRDDHWYHVYFFYKDENKVLYTWVRQGFEDITTFAFVATKDYKLIEQWKDINKDFSWSENKLQKQEFERRILNKIKEQIKQSNIK